MRSAVLIAVMILLCACRPLSSEEQVKRKYDRYHSELVAYCQTERHRISSYLGGYGGIPSYQAIVALGPPAVPYMRRSIRNKEGDAYILADAIVEIKKWNRDDFTDVKGMGAAAEPDRVLARLDTSMI